MLQTYEKFTTTREYIYIYPRNVSVLESFLDFSTTLKLNEIFTEMPSTIFSLYLEEERAQLRAVELELESGTKFYLARGRMEGRYEGNENESWNEYRRDGPYQ